MATGTGKTYTAFQIIWRLWKAGRRKRILFLADRNVLVDQTIVNDFRPFGAAMAKLSTGSKTIERADGTSHRSSGNHKAGRPVVRSLAPGPLRPYRKNRQARVYSSFGFPKRRAG